MDERTEDGTCGDTSGAYVRAGEGAAAAAMGVHESAAAAAAAAAAMGVDAASAGEGSGSDAPQLTEPSGCDDGAGDW